MGHRAMTAWCLAQNKQFIGNGRKNLMVGHKAGRSGETG
jgi:hypothetical protein